MNEWVEYRAIIRRPASILDSEEDQERGYVLFPSVAGTSRKDVRGKDYFLRYWEKTLAETVSWQTRTVSATEWSDEK